MIPQPGDFGGGNYTGGKKNTGKITLKYGYWFCLGVVLKGKLTVARKK